MVRGLVTLFGSAVLTSAIDDESGLLQGKAHQVQEEQVRQASGTDSEWWWSDPEPPPPEANGALGACLLDNGVRKWDEIVPMSMDDRRNTVIVFLNNEGYGSVSSLQGKTNGHLIHLCPQRPDAQRVYVGSSGSNEKCVPYDNVVDCEVNAGDYGQRMNFDYHHARDAFHVSVRDGHVCARRTDVNHGWGMQLEFRCSTKPSGTLRIGNSGGNVKCVEHGSVDAALQCAANAGDPGIRVNPDYVSAPDRFEITTGNGQVCAKRLDHNGGWGMQLEIRCDENLDVCDERLPGDREDGYRGCQDHTITGERCQKWTSQSPNKHTRTSHNYPNKGLGDHNFCRNPDGESNIWCYSDNWMIRWQHCAPRKHVCDETYQGDGSGYRGCTSKTHMGKTCQQWTSQSPHKHTRTATEYPSMGIGFHNHCRNPDGAPKIWCYTVDDATRWDFCDHPHLWCDASDCSHHGDSNDKDRTDGCDCMCKDGYSGRDCSIPPPCGAQEHCSGHGKTSDLDATNGCECDCTDEYRGQDCSIPPACSSEHHCNGHATLDLDSTDGCECSCAKGWSGDSCDVPPPCNAASDCNGHGSTTDADATNGCECKCEAGWTGKDCSEPTKICCRAMTADCLACAADMTADEYCGLHPATHGCKPPEPEPPVCCQAMIPSCLACQAGLTEKEYCEKYPLVEGCGADDIIDDC